MIAIKSRSLLWSRLNEALTHTLSLRLISLAWVQIGSNKLGRTDVTPTQQACGFLRFVSVLVQRVVSAKFVFDFPNDQG